MVLSIHGDNTLIQILCLDSVHSEHCINNQKSVLGFDPPVAGTEVSDCDGSVSISSQISKCDGGNDINLNLSVIPECDTASWL